MAKLKIQKLHKDALIPEAKTDGAVGLDLASVERVKLRPCSLCVGAYSIPTGLAMEIPKGYHGEIYLRSSIGKKTKLRLANQVGIIDSDFRGEIKILVENIGRHDEVIEAGERIAQFILVKNTPVEIVEAETLSETERGSGGFGSTGK